MGWHRAERSRVPFRRGNPDGHGTFSPRTEFVVGMGQESTGRMGIATEASQPSPAMTPLFLVGFPPERLGGELPSGWLLTIIRHPEVRNVELQPLSDLCISTPGKVLAYRAT